MTVELYTVGFGKPATASIDVLGGKGFNLVKMANMGVNGPPAVIVPTIYCAPVNDKSLTPMAIQMQVIEQLEQIEEQFGYMPLFSIRSGSKVSMPGMMETILNVGLCKDNIKDWEKRIGERAAWDSYRRLIQMFGDVVFHTPSSKYEAILDAIKASEGVATDAELSVKALKSVVVRFLDITLEFPQSFKMQLRKAIGAVFSSWNTERAITYRNLHNIPHNLGTAVIVQAMVFGNFNEKSCTGVLFTRNPSTGENKVNGEYLINAQGEDVVAGIRTPLHLETMQAWNPTVLAELIATVNNLETEARDMQDVEFTVQDGKLFILQTRNGKRTAVAALKIAADLVDEGFISRGEAFKRVSYEQYLTAQSPVINPLYAVPPAGKGIPASSGFAVGVAAFSSVKAVEMAKNGATVILLAKETTPDDIAGMHAAVGILTQTGGSSSHAAVVARGMDKVCVVGCLDLVVKVAGIDGEVKAWELNGALIEEGTTKITIEGTTGKIWVNTDVEIIGAENDPAIAKFNSWVSEALPFMEEVTGGAAGYLKTDSYDNDLQGLVKVIANFEGVISLNTGKTNIASYDQPLFELVTAFDEDSIKKAKVAALVNTQPSKPIYIDSEGYTFSSTVKAKLTGNGYKFIPVISSLEGVVLGTGLVRFADSFVLTEAAKKALAMKKAIGESLQPLVFVDDFAKAKAVEGALVVASKETALKSLMN